MSILKKRELTTTQMIVAGFFVAIMIGAVLLALPISSRDGIWTNFVDALFASTTSICVTGLTTVNTLEHWSLFGEVIILCLIQFGGLGVVTFATSILLMLGKRITLKERLLIQDSYNLDKVGGLVKLTIKIIKGSFLVEGIGAIFFSFQFIPEFGWSSGIWKSIFHSISSFCNAGIDIIGADSFIRYRGSIIVNLTTMTLVVLGGLGFPVWWDFVRVLALRMKEKFTLKIFFAKLNLHSKLVLTVTMMLILSGAVVILLLEHNNPGTLGNLPWYEKILASIFQSVTTRTAGYCTIPQENLTNATAFFCILFMVVGGSPSGTAGGIKTITLVVLVLAVVSIVQRKEHTEIYHRRIAENYIRKGLAVTLIYFFMLILFTMLLSIVEKAAFIDILYEVTSALSTVGLTRNITSSLSTPGKFIIIISMYLGRIGPISMALFFNAKKVKRNGRSFPEGKIIVG